jgi:hypothetical protein
MSALRGITDIHAMFAHDIYGVISKAKMRFQSFFMLITVQPSFFASSNSSCVNVPTLLSGRPSAGPYAYSRVGSSWRTSISSARHRQPRCIPASAGRRASCQTRQQDDAQSSSECPAAYRRHCRCWRSQNLKCGLRATLTIAACASIGLDGTAGTGTRALPCRVPNRLRGLCLALLVC